MPFYEYQCEYCSDHGTVYRSLPLDSIIKHVACNQCGKPAKRVISWVAHRGKHKGYNAPPIPEQCK